MQIITLDTNSTLVFTLYEKQTLTSPYWLFELRLRGTNKFKYFIAADISAYPTRYNQFTFTDSATENPTSGTINLTETGEYHYRIFEQTSASNLDPSLATSEVECGIIKVITTTGVTTYTNNPTQTNYFYNPT